MSNVNQKQPRVPVAAGSEATALVSNAPIWWKEIGGQSNTWMSHKAFWLRAAAHYREPYWHDMHRYMHALRQIKCANKHIREYCLNTN